MFNRAFFSLTPLCSALIAAALISVGGAVSLYAQGFVTSVRVDCNPDSSGTVRIELFRDAVPLSNDFVSCTEGAVTTLDVVTAEEPNVWRIGGSAAGGSIAILCPEEASTRFPAVYQCAAGKTGVHVMAFRPRSAD